MVGCGKSRQVLIWFIRITREMKFVFEILHVLDKKMSDELKNILNRKISDDLKNASLNNLRFDSLKFSINCHYYYPADSCIMHVAFIGTLLYQQYLLLNIYKTACAVGHVETGTVS